MCLAITKETQIKDFLQSEVFFFYVYVAFFSLIIYYFKVILLIGLF